LLNRLANLTKKKENYRYLATVKLKVKVIFSLQNMEILMKPVPGFKKSLPVSNDNNKMLEPHRFRV
jgi:hypothetical protein